MAITARITSALVFAVLFAVTCAGEAQATCYYQGRVEICCAGGENCRVVGPAPGMRSASPNAWSLGGSVFVGGQDGAVGGLELQAGFRRQTQPGIRNLIGRKVTWSALCAPVLCGLAGIILLPGKAIPGDEFGVDIRARLVFGAQPGVELAVRPIARYTGLWPIRTASFLGAILPEVGVASGAGSRWSLTWYPLPLELLLGARNRVKLDVGVGFQRTFDADPATRGLVRVYAGWARLF